MITRQSVSAVGDAAVLTALRRLSQPTQNRQMDIVSQRLKQSFDLEKHHLDVLASDRRERRIIASNAKLRRDIFGFVAVLVVLGIVAYLYGHDQKETATPILTLAIGLVSGWVGGAGYSKRKRGASDD
jgi:hypothetical protein